MHPKGEKYLSKKTERRIMRYILDWAEFGGTYFIKQKPGYSPAEFELYDDDDIKKLGVSNVVYALEMLQHQGYIKLSSTDDEQIVILTSKGRFYFEQIRRERWDFIKKSILTPIVVSAAVSLLVSFIVRILWP